MNPDDLSDIRLDRDPDHLLPEDWDDVTDGEIADLIRRVMAEAAEHV